MDSEAADNNADVWNGMLVRMVVVTKKMTDIFNLPTTSSSKYFTNN